MVRALLRTVLPWVVLAVAGPGPARAQDAAAPPAAGPTAPAPSSPPARPAPSEGTGGAAPGLPKDPLAKPRAAAAVLAAIARAAQERAALPEAQRLEGDALADLYVKRAAAAADGDPRAFLVGLARAVDDRDVLLRLPLTARTFAGLETEEAAAARRAAMGRPTLRLREDWLAHFVFSAVLAALVGERAAAAFGLAKEVADAQGASGFSFADLLADDAGIAFARWLLAADGAARLAKVAAGFAGARFLPDPTGLPDGLTAKQFEEAYGGLEDPRFLAKRRAMLESVAATAAAW